MEVEPFRRPEWEPLPFDGCVNVEGRVLLWDETLGLALLRFGEHATIHEHPGENETFVFCLEGRGWTSVGDESAELHAGERVVWPAGVRHRLWTEATIMTTLMCDRLVT